MYVITLGGIYIVLALGGRKGEAYSCGALLVGEANVLYKNLAWHSRVPNPASSKSHDKLLPTGCVFFSFNLT